MKDKWATTVSKMCGGEKKNEKKKILMSQDFVVDWVGLGLEFSLFNQKICKIYLNTSWFII